MGQSRDLGVVVRNTGTVTLTIRSLTISNPRFSLVSPAAPFTVAVGATQQVTVRFAPTAAGPESGTLTLAIDDPALPAVAVPLTGSGSHAPPAGAPRIEASPAAVGFGAIAPAGQTTQPLTIRNTGAAPLTITAVAIAAPEFQLIGVVVPLTIQPQSSASWTLRFSAAAVGSYSSALVVTSNDPANPTLRVPLSGTAAGVEQAPRIRLSESTIDFGGVKVGDTSDRTITISNTGNTPLVVESIRSDNGRFTLPASTSFTLPVGTLFDLRVVFRPSSAGPQTGVILIQSNDPTSPTRLTVSGAGQ